MIGDLAIPLPRVSESPAPKIFSDLWDMPTEWVEPPNNRRGGWSGATRVTLRDSDGNQVPCILKKQENHFYYALANGLRPRPTFEREAKNLRYLKTVGIPVPEVLHYGRRIKKGADQAVLLIPELVDYVPLSSILSDPNKVKSSGKAIARAIGELANKLHHEVKWYHRNFYPKHIFLKIDSGQIEVCLIDLENARPLKRAGQVLKDLGPLFRRAQGTGNLRITDQVTFMKSYCQCHKLGRAERLLMEQITAKKS